MHASTCVECAFPYKQSDSFFTDVEAEGYIRKHYVLKSMNDLPSRIFSADVLACLVWPRRCVKVTVPNIQDLTEITQNLLTKKIHVCLLKEVSVIYEGKKKNPQTDKESVSLSIHTMILSTMQVEFQTCYDYC